MNRFFRRILNVVEKLEGAACAIGLFATTLLIFAQVLNRYLFHFEIMWLGDLALFVFIFFMLVAAAYTTWNKGHVAVDFLRERITRGKPKAEIVYRLFLNLLALAALWSILPVAYRFMARALKYPEYGTLVRWFNTSWLQETLFITLFLVLIHLLVILGGEIGELYRMLRGSTREGDR
jgi:TRAP-type C4-dicarboxylate transport system permease small subunit